LAAAADLFSSKLTEPSASSHAYIEQEVDTVRKSLAIILAIMLVMVLVLPMAASADNKGKAKNRGLSVRGKVQTEGIVTSVDPGSSMFTMQLTRRDNRVGTDTVVVLVQRATQLQLAGRDDDDDDDDERSRYFATINDIRVGDRVRLEGFRLDDGRILALKLNIRNRRIADRRGERNLPSRGVVAQGVVSAKSFNHLTVVGSDGVTRVVLVTPATDVRGQRNSFGAIQTNDVVVVQGTVNADGSVSARQIEVVFASGGTAFNGGGTQRTGVITAKSTTGGQFLILDNSFAVNISGDTRILWGGQLRSFGDLQVGQRVTVSGDPIRVGGITVGINARVISL
jgi:hypothetical protein